MQVPYQNTAPPPFHVPLGDRLPPAGTDETRNWVVEAMAEEGGRGGREYSLASGQHGEAPAAAAGWEEATHDEWA
jgi:hypothetical protein